MASKPEMTGIFFGGDQGRTLKNPKKILDKSKKIVNKSKKFHPQIQKNSSTNPSGWLLGKFIIQKFNKLDPPQEFSYVVPSHTPVQVDTIGKFLGGLAGGGGGGSNIFNYLWQNILSPDFKKIFPDS